MPEKQQKIIKFKVHVSIGFVGCDDFSILEVYPEDLEGVQKEEWDDYVWEHLGGKEVAFDLVEMCCYRVDDEDGE